jgi:hypothetical protein
VAPLDQARQQHVHQRDGGARKHSAGEEQPSWQRSPAGQANNEQRQSRQQHTLFPVAA